VEATLANARLDSSLRCQWTPGLSFWTKWRIQPDVRRRLLCWILRCAQD